MTGRLRVVTDVDHLLASRVGTAHSHPVVRADDLGLAQAILKCRSASLNELLAYRLAGLLGLSTADMAGVWFKVPNDEKERGFRNDDVGVLIRFFDDFTTVSREEAAVRAPDVAGAALAICSFDRHEWGEFGSVNGNILFFDLEYILPAMDARWLTAAPPYEQRRFLHESGGYYWRAASTFAEQAIEEAVRLGVLVPFRRAIERLAQTPNDAIMAVFDISPHPLADTVGPFAYCHARRTIELVTSMLRI